MFPKLSRMVNIFTALMLANATGCVLSILYVMEINDVYRSPMDRATQWYTYIFLGSTSCVFILTAVSFKILCAILNTEYPSTRGTLSQLRKSATHIAKHAEITLPSPSSDIVYPKSNTFLHLFSTFLSCCCTITFICIALACIDIINMHINFFIKFDLLLFLAPIPFLLFYMIHIFKMLRIILPRENAELKYKHQNLLSCIEILESNINSRQK